MVASNILTMKKINKQLSVALEELEVLSEEVKTFREEHARIVEKVDLACAAAGLDTGNSKSQIDSLEKKVDAVLYAVAKDSATVRYNYRHAEQLGLGLGDS